MSEISATRKAALWVGVVFLLGAALGGMIGYGFAHRSCQRQALLCRSPLGGPIEWSNSHSC